MRMEWQIPRTEYMDTPDGFIAMDSLSRLIRIFDELTTTTTEASKAARVFCKRISDANQR